MTTNELPDRPGISPIGNSLRSVLYDDRGDPYWTEWQMLGPSGLHPPNGLVAAVAGLRPPADALSRAQRIVHHLEQQ